MSITTKVFAVKIPDEMDIYVYEALMPHIDLAKEMRLRKFLKEKDRLRSLFGDLLLRVIIMEETGLNNNAILFNTNEFGKPFLVGYDDVQFNISHSGDWLVAAVDSKPVGIDIELIQPVGSDLAMTVFSNEENSDLMKCVISTEWLSYFFKLWALKESYIKFIGEGANFPLNDFSINCKDPDDITLKVKGKLMLDIHMTLYQIDDQYKMALCLHHKNFPQYITFIKTETLIKYFLS
jgi:4'-phosphopantetheinyl transferase